MKVTAKCPRCESINECNITSTNDVFRCHSCGVKFRKKLPTNASTPTKTHSSSSHSGSKLSEIHTDYGTSKVLAWISWLSFLLGIFLPVMTVSSHVEKFYITIVDESKTSSIIGAAFDLLFSDNFLIGLLIIIFSILLPAAKLLATYSVWDSSISGDASKTMETVSILSKWSMMDVMLVAIIIAVVKLGSAAEVESRVGLYFFAISVIASKLYINLTKNALKSVSA